MDRSFEQTDANSVEQEALSPVSPPNGFELGMGFRD